MDHETLKLLAKIKVAARKVMKVDVDLQRLAADRLYCQAVLGKATECDDEDLVLAAITLQDRMGLLRPIAARDSLPAGPPPT